MVHFVLGVKYVKATAFFRIMLDVWNGDHPDDVKRLTVTAIHDQAAHLCGPVPLEHAYLQELKHVKNSNELVEFIGSIYPFYRVRRRRVG